MAMGCVRAMNYPISMFSETSSDFLEPSRVKVELMTYDCGKESPMNFLSYAPKKAEPTLPYDHNDCDMNDAGSPQLTSWTTKHPEHWTQKEVLDWIFSVVDSDNNMDGSKFQGELYKDLTGEVLCKMSKEDFDALDSYYGSKMYETFKLLISSVLFKRPLPAYDVTNLEIFNHLNHMHSNNINKDIANSIMGTQQRNGQTSNTKCISNNGLVVHKTDNDMNVELPFGFYPISTDFEEFPSSSLMLSSSSKLSAASSFTCPPPLTSHSPLPNFSSLSSSLPTTLSSSSSFPSSSPSFCQVYSPPLKESTVARYHRGASSSSTASSSSSSTGAPSTPRTVPLSLPLSVPSSALSSSSSSSPPLHFKTDNMDPGYHSEESVSGTSFMPPYELPSGHMFGPCHHSEDMDIDINDGPDCRMARYPQDRSQNCHQMEDKKKSGKKNRNNTTKNGNHLWEFVRDLLRDPSRNPKLLKWEDKENGVFRFVQSEAVAQLWGEKKNNPQMTYEKLSRAMRFCRSAGYFDAVPKNGKFPKKLCFMFGGKAHGWKD